MITFVSALINLQEDRPNEKTIDTYVSLFDTLQSTGIRIHLFASQEFAERIQLKNGVVEKIELADLDTYKQAPQGLPDIRTPSKDTRNYLILMNAKVELVNRAIRSGKYSSSHYAWIDAGICHVVRNKDTITRLAIRNFPSRCMFVPGCNSVSTHTFDKIDWRFCGGFFLGDVESLEQFHHCYKESFSHLVKLTWEVNVWALFEEWGWKPNWYKADHNDSILNIPTILRIPSHVDVYWYGELSKCYPNGPIDKYLASVVNGRKHVVFPQSDGLTVEDSYKSPNTITAALCTRGFMRKDILLLPLDDDTFEHGLMDTLSKYRRVPWEDKLPKAFWRGGTSGTESITPRVRVVDALFSNPHADVRFTRGVSDSSDARISPEKFAPCRVSIEDHFRYKYIFIIDGNVIASSHQWVFGSESVPIMVTHPDNHYWFERFLQPMKNYVPISYDLSDLNEKLEWLVTHDAEAKEIADNAMYLARTLFSSEFQKAYVRNEVDRIIRDISTFGIAIPCYKPHIFKLKRCLESIEKQTVRPNTVVVVCSSSEPTDIPADWNFSFPHKIITRLDRRNAAQNRNEAVRHLSTDIVSFFDADDIMYPNRIEILKQCSSDIILHSFTEETDEYIQKAPSYIRNQLTRAPSGCAILNSNAHAKIHHAHVTCCRSILNSIQFREEKEFERREDAVFCGDVLGIEGITNCYIPEPLSYYNPEGITIELPNT